MATQRRTVHNFSISQRRAAEIESIFRSGTEDAHAGGSTAGIIGHRPAAPLVPGSADMTQQRALIRLESDVEVGGGFLFDRPGIHARQRITAGRAEAVEWPAVSGGLTSDSTYTPVSAYTAAFLVRPVDLRDPSADCPIAYLGTSPAAATRDFALRRKAGEETITCSVSRFGAETDVGAFAFDPSRYQWAFLRVAGTSAELVVDGTPQGVVTVPSLSAVASNLVLGSDADANCAECYFGAAYIVEEWLDDDEIKARMEDAPPSVLPKSWKVAWRPSPADVSSGAIVDRSQSSNDATITNEVWENARNPAAPYSAVRDRWQLWQKRAAILGPGGVGKTIDTPAVFDLPVSWTREFTIRVPKRFEFTKGAGARIANIGNGGGAGTEAFVILQPDGTIDFLVDRKNAANRVTLSTTTVVADGNLYRIRLEVIGETTTAKIYVDGVEEASSGAIGPHVFASGTSDTWLGFTAAESGLVEISDIVTWCRAGANAPEHRGVEGRWCGAAEDPSIFQQYTCLEGNGSTLKNIGSTGSGDATLTNATWTTWYTPVESTHLVDPVDERPGHVVFDFGEEITVGDVLYEVLDPEPSASWGLKYFDVAIMLRPEAGAQDVNPTGGRGQTVAGGGWPGRLVGRSERGWQVQLDATTADEAGHLEQLFGQLGRLVAVRAAGADDPVEPAHEPHRSAVGVISGAPSRQRALDPYFQWTISVPISEAQL